MAIADDRCDICHRAGLHAHSPTEVEQERYMRPAFERLVEGLRLWAADKALYPDAAFRWRQRRGFALGGTTSIHSEYLLPHIQAHWQTWQHAWCERGEMFPEMKDACKSACGV